jgi:hypothetical protein
MAKVKSPLFGFGASGQLAKTLVYMSWKGINTIRQHVIPANPDTTDQKTQRGYIRAAVLLWHTTVWTILDHTAWNRYASIKSRPMSGYNAFTSDFITAQLAALTFNAMYTFTVVSAVAGQAVVTVLSTASLTSMKVRYGVSKTAMFQGDDLVEAGGPAGTYTVTLSGLVEDANYFFQVYSDDVAEVGNTGIALCKIMKT